MHDSSNPTGVFCWDFPPALQCYSHLLPKLLLNFGFEIFWPFKNPNSINIKINPLSSLMKRSVKLNQELLAVLPSSSFCHLLTCFVIPTTFGSLSLCSGKLWFHNTAPTSCDEQPEIHQRWVFVPWISQTGLQRHEDSQFHPSKITFGKWELGPNLFSGDAATQQLGARSEIKVFWEKANGSGQVTFPGGIVWPPKVTESIGRF